MVEKVQGTEKCASRLRYFLRSGRFWLAGPLVFVTALMVMAGAAVWMPGGAAGVDNIVLPLMLFPVFWGGLFFYACLTVRVNRGVWVLGGLALSQIVIVTHNVMQ